MARSNQHESSEQIIHTETRCVTETMVRLEHKSPQPDFQSDLQLTVPTAKPIESNAHVIDNTNRAYYKHTTHPIHIDRVECDLANTEHNREMVNGIGIKRIAPKEVCVVPKLISGGYQVYQSANVPLLDNGRLTSPEKSNHTFLSEVTGYELKAPALVSSIASQSLANGHLLSGKSVPITKSPIETESMDSWSMRKQENSIKIDATDAMPKSMQFAPQTHAIEPIYYNSFNHTESKHSNNIIQKLDSRHDATPMQTQKKVRIHKLLRTTVCCLCIEHNYTTQPNTKTIININTHTHTHKIHRIHRDDY